MTLKKLKPFLLNYLGSIEEYPWGPSPMVIKVGGKIFAIVGLESNPVTISLKCDPEDAIIQRCLYLVIQPGYHLNICHSYTKKGKYMQTGLGRKNWRGQFSPLNIEQKTRLLYLSDNDLILNSHNLVLGTRH